MDIEPRKGLTMERAFESLRKAISHPGRSSEIDQDDVTRFAANSVVAFAVGGLGSRMQRSTDTSGTNKSVMKLPSGDTMFEYSIRMYREAGFRAFVALVAHQAQSIVELVGDGTHLGVQIAYSHDPGGPVGRGGANRNALANGSIPRSHPTI
jgi:hypothetical protein